jgi:hypothetical protein
VEGLKGVLELARGAVGGGALAGGGGVDAAALYEWGGRNADGTDGFARNRPGWPEPVHALLVRHRVNAVFHGHDHLYAKQDLDGIVYQELPQPGNPRANARNAADYGYRTGTVRSGAGFLRVAVSPERATIDYIRSDQPRDSARPSVEHAYSLPAKR